MRTFEHNGTTYDWHGGFGGIFKSYENRVRRGDCRYICNRIFYAYLVYPRWFAKNEVCWTLTQNLTLEEISCVKRDAFGIS